MQISSFDLQTRILFNFCPSLNHAKLCKWSLEIKEGQSQWGVPLRVQVKSCRPSTSLQINQLYFSLLLCLHSMWSMKSDLSLLNTVHYSSVIFLTLLLFKECKSEWCNNYIDCAYLQSNTLFSEPVLYFCLLYPIWGVKSELVHQLETKSEDNMRHNLSFVVLRTILVLPVVAVD